MRSLKSIYSETKRTKSNVTTLLKLQVSQNFKYAKRKHNTDALQLQLAPVTI